jgi:hypothetical protein
MKVPGILFLFLLTSPVWSQTRLEYAPAPPDNPLKGFVPYVEIDQWERFPHSMEFHYFSLRDLMKGYDEFDWSPVEEKLELCRSRGCQMTFRVMMEYPGKPNSVPQFLIDDGVEITEWTREAADGGVCHTPDYEDPKLRKALSNFIAAFGKKYDGDPRIGYLSAGLLGSWGEWHTHPRGDLWASKETQEIVLDEFEKAFSSTPILLRYPAKEGHWDQAPNAHRRFGYHDDSFNWATLETGREEDSWFFIPLLKNAGALEKWKTQPIAGELRPELWKTSFTPERHPQDQGFDKSVRATHVSWLLDTGLFSSRYELPEERRRNAIRAAQKMGYEFHIASWQKVDGGIEIVVENRGVAPFYHDWLVELATGEKVVATFDLRGLLPGETRTWKASVDSVGPFQLRVPNPMEGGKPLRFANKEQGAEWLVLP